MRVMFSADWHIKLNQKNVPSDWAKNRYRSMFEQMHGLEDKVDMHVIGGDIFDKLPNMEELELYFEFIAGSRCKTIVFAGNHESVKKHTTFFTQLKDVSKRINKLVEVIDSYYTLDNMNFIPYNMLKQFEKEYKNDLMDVNSGSILFTHVRGNIPPHVKAEVDLDIFKQWDVVLAGDLHDKSCSQLNIHYPGSPLTTSFHRNEKETGVIIIDSVSLEQEWLPLQLPQLIRKTIVAGDPMPKTEYHHTIYEVTGDMDQLGNVENSDLIDKKVVKRSTECALILKPEATIQEELVEYLTYIVELPEDTIEKVLAEFNDNIKGIL